MVIRLFFIGCHSLLDAGRVLLTMHGPIIEASRVHQPIILLMIIPAKIVSVVEERRWQTDYTLNFSLPPFLYFSSVNCWFRGTVPLMENCLFLSCIDQGIPRPRRILQT